MRHDKPHPLHPRTRELLDFLLEQRVVLRSAFDSVPPEAREQAPASDRWSAAGVIEHLAIVETRVVTRLESALADARQQGLAEERQVDAILPTIDLPALLNRRVRASAPDVSHPTGKRAHAAWQVLEQAGNSVREVLRSSDGLDLSAVSSPHPLFGPLTLYEWFAFVGAHEARHADQIREIADALGASNREKW